MVLGRPRATETHRQDETYPIVLSGGSHFVADYALNWRTAEMENGSSRKDSRGGRAQGGLSKKACWEYREGKSLSRMWAHIRTSLRLCILTC